MRVPARALSLAATTVLVLTATACGERSEPTGPASDLFPLTVTGGDERPVALQAPALRIALLDPAFESTLVALGAGARIVGTPLSANGELRPAVLRRLEPDLVVASEQTDGQTLSRADAVTDAPIYVAQGASLSEVERTITQLGAITATPAAARRLVRGLEQRRRAVVRRVRERPRVSVFVDLGFFTTASDQTLVGDLVRIAGGRNVAGSVAGPLDVADLRRLDPDVYVSLAESGLTLSELRKDRLLSHLRAVRTGRVVFVGAAALDPGPHLGSTLQQLARALHPDAFR